MAFLKDRSARTCIVCKAEFVPEFLRKNTFKLFCSNRCYSKANPRPGRHQLKPVVLVKKTCVKCGKEFVSHKHLGQKYCSRKCSKSKGFNSHYRRLLVQKLVARDGRQCCICGELLNLKVKYPAHDYVTIDHIVPQSKGGSNRYANCQLAHHRCNCEVKSDFSSYRMFLFV